MRDSVMWFLVSSVVITALFIVHVRHQHRIAYVAFQTEQTHRDDIIDEWGRLLIEENLYGFPHLVETNASKVLSMRAPLSKDVEFVGLSGKSARGKFANVHEDEGVKKVAVFGEVLDDAR